MLRDISLPGYKTKWVCKSCGANHFYKPSGGQCLKCEWPRLQEVQIADEVKFICKACKTSHTRIPISGKCLNCEFTQFTKVTIEKTKT